MTNILFKIARICPSQFKCNYLQNEELFFNFLFHFWDLNQVLNVLKEKMIVIANVFPKLQAVKIFVRRLSKKRRFRTRSDSQHVKASQILAKSSWERFYHVFSSFSGKLIWKMSPIVSSEILGFLLKHWMTMASMLFKIARICNSQFKCNYLKNEKLFRNFLFHFSNLHQILNLLKKRAIVIANISPKLKTVKNFVRPISKKRCFRTRFDSQHVKASQTLAKFPWENFYHIFSSFSGKLIWKMSPIVLSQILGVFVTTFNVDGKHPGSDCKNLQLPIQMQLSEKRKTLSQFFVPFLESTSNFKSFEEKGHCHS